MSCLDCGSEGPSLACTSTMPLWAEGAGRGTGELVASPSSNNREYLQHAASDIRFVKSGKFCFEASNDSYCYISIDTSFDST